MICCDTSYDKGIVSVGVWAAQNMLYIVFVEKCVVVMLPVFFNKK